MLRTTIFFCCNGSFFYAAHDVILNVLMSILLCFTSSFINVAPGVIGMFL